MKSYGSTHQAWRRPQRPRASGGVLQRLLHVEARRGRERGRREHAGLLQALDELLQEQQRVALHLPELGMVEVTREDVAVLVGVVRREVHVRGVEDEDLARAPLAPLLPDAEAALAVAEPQGQVRREHDVGVGAVPHHRARRHPHEADLVRPEVLEGAEHPLRRAEPLRRGPGAPLHQADGAPGGGRALAGPGDLPELRVRGLAQLPQQERRVRGQRRAPGVLRRRVHRLLGQQPLEVRGELPLALAELEGVLRAAPAGHDVHEGHHARELLGRTGPILQLHGVPDGVEELHRVGALAVGLQRVRQLLREARDLLRAQPEHGRGEPVRRPAQRRRLALPGLGRREARGDALEHVAVGLLLPLPRLPPRLLRQPLGPRQLPLDGGVAGLQLGRVGELHLGLLVLVQVAVPPGLAEHGLGVLRVELQGHLAEADRVRRVGGPALRDPRPLEVAEREVRQEGELHLEQQALGPALLPGLPLPPLLPLLLRGPGPAPEQREGLLVPVRAPLDLALLDPVVALHAHLLHPLEDKLVARQRPHPLHLADNLLVLWLQDGGRRESGERLAEALQLGQRPGLAGKGLRMVLVEEEGLLAGLQSPRRLSRRLAVQLAEREA
mmetsp:Transcript_3573/g.11115  ORF Transcript_3573/g.11115 Transcript_3573/m.11115 type:complete len:612 (-) Transcript_3573:576-2411(-)